MSDSLPLVLVVDDEKDIRELISHLLEQEGITVRTVCDGRTAIDEMRRHFPDLLILDLKLPDIGGMEILREAHSLDGELPVVMLTGQGGVRDAVEAIRAHAFDFLSKPYDHKELLDIVRSGLAERKLRQSSRTGDGQTNPRDELFEIMGRSDSVASLIADVNRVAGCNFNVVIIGETGSGKEVVAHAIHKGSTRKDKPFVPIDCGAIPETLIESKLFGHEKGAFTGAVGTNQGLFEQADGGTLFLDEILNMPLSAQAKVLRALQEKCIYRVGGSRQIGVDVRVLAAGSRNLEHAASEGHFRLDLLYRLSEFKLRIPSLRERAEDISHLANRFLEMTNRELGKDVRGFSDEALRLLLGCLWPGNVRQLRSTIRRAVLLADEVVEARHLDISEKSCGDPSESKENSGAGDESVPDLPLRQIVAQNTMAIERLVLMRTMRRTNGNKAKAARLLQIDYKTIQSKLKQYGITKLQEAL